MGKQPRAHLIQPLPGFKEDVGVRSTHMRWLSDTLLGTYNQFMLFFTKVWFAAVCSQFVVKIVNKLAWKKRHSINKSTFYKFIDL